MFFPTDLGHAEIRWDGPRATLLLDGVESSAVDASDPSYLEFEYMQHMSCALGAALPPPGPVRALHLGGAACALACAWEATRPGSRQVCAEVDALLAHRVREHFPIPRSPRVRIRVGDGRAVVDAARPGAWDVVVRDAFVGGAVPEHLRTRECAAAVARALRPGGLYLLNCAHGGGANAHRDVAAVLEEFPLVLTVQDPKVGRGGRLGNVVAIGVNGGEFDADALDRALRRLPLPARLWRPGEVRRWAAGARPPLDASAQWPPA